MSRPTPNQATRTFGLGLTNGPADGWEFLERLPAREAFDFIELSGEMLENPLPGGKLRLPYPVAHVGRLVSASLARTIPAQSRYLRRDFAARVCRLASEPMEALGAKSFSIDFDVESYRAAPANYAALVEVIKQVAPTLFATGRRLALSLRIPSPNPVAANASALVQLIADSMSPQLGIELSVHPHEVRGEIDVDEIFSWIRFDLLAVRFVYEPEVGNHLVPKLLEPWLHCMDDNLVGCPVFFCPFVNSADFYLKEAERLETLVNELHVPQSPLA